MVSAKRFRHFLCLSNHIQNDEQHASNSEVEHEEEDAVFSEDARFESCADTRQQAGHVAPPPANFPQCPRYRRYQHPVAESREEVQHAHPTSVSPASSGPSPLTPCRIKEEPSVSEDGTEEGCNPELCTEEVLEMELEVEGVPAEPSGSCLRSYLQRGGLDLSTMPSTAIQQLLSSQLTLSHYRELLRDRPRPKGDHISRGSSSSQYGGELDRRSVIFSSAVGERRALQTDVDEKLRDKVSALMEAEMAASGQTVSIQTRTGSPVPSEAQTSSSRSSVSHPEDGFSPTPHSGSGSALSHCLDQVEPPEAGHARIKSEQEFGASGGNSSDESSSFSEGDSEGGATVSRPEVSTLPSALLLFGWV